MIPCVLQAIQRLPKKQFLMLERSLELPFLPPPKFELCFAEGCVELADELASWIHDDGDRFGHLLLSGEFGVRVSDERKIEERVEMLWKHDWVLINTTGHLLEEAKHRKYYEHQNMSQPAYVPY